MREVSLGLTSENSSGSLEKSLVFNTRTSDELEGNNIPSTKKKNHNF